MENIESFLFEGEHLVRVVEKDGEKWFVGLDFCRVLEIVKHHQALERLDLDERGTCIVGTPGGPQETVVVSEAGVYRLVFTSRKPVAERFKRWLAHDVIPSIRKTGFYTHRQPDEVTPPPTLESRPFPDWPLEEMRTKRSVVDMYRHLYGTMAAQWITPQLGFPSPPLELVERGRQYSMTLVVPRENGANA